MNKTLAVVGRILTIDPIPNADRIKLATVVCGSSGKWQGVVGLNTDPDVPVVVFLQDAILPPDPRWKFLESSKWRIKMARFRGAPSECLILPISEFPELSGTFETGQDLTNTLGVTKYEKPLPPGMTGSAKGNFPAFIPKTDEENFQRVPELVERMSSEDWVATMKMDGTSCTAWVDDEGELHVASRNLELKEFGERPAFGSTGATNVYWRCARLLKLENLPKGIALQFEVCGPNIQGNPAGFKELCGFAFKAWNIAERRYLDRDEFLLLAVKCSFSTAPRMFAGNIPDVRGLYSADELRNMANLKYPNGEPAEGIVIAARSGEWSFKVINLEYKK